MKVLTDWMTGNPPMPGMWLARPVGERYHDGVLVHWTGSEWVWEDGLSAMRKALVEWRGLAFDPNAARHVLCDVYDERSGVTTRQFRVGWIIPETNEVPR